MTLAFMRRSLAVAAIAAAAVLASCTTGPSQAELEAQRMAEAQAAAAAAAAAVRVAPPISMNAGVAESAAIYVSFLRDVGTIRGGFPDAESIQAAMRKGAAYDPIQLSQGMIAYASIVALQSPEFVAGVRQYGVDPVQRRQVIENIVYNPAYAATLPGAEAGAGLIIATLGRDISDMVTIADAVEQDAYTIQARGDSRRSWAVAPLPNRAERLEAIKQISGRRMMPPAEDTARLYAAANSGSGLSVPGGTSRPPYTPVIANALAMAALAALGAAGDEARPNTQALMQESGSEFCLSMSKLNLFQCLAASRPSYEDMFCVGRHIVRDLGTCTFGATRVPVISVSAPSS
ncbi:hypothetical protein [Brevundimonas sp.]|uniref:hypothetical protein n=1 Tax=Brevundimonas sp. TaxID=1871086 RepID=UPI001A35B109|nr:hypothetical protein [Brevundimonas sp.]MBJ7483055.1 hypothetical protein [Brevundimonas sp.]